MLGCRPRSPSPAAGSMQHLEVIKPPESVVVRRSLKATVYAIFTASNQKCVQIFFAHYNYSGESLPAPSPSQWAERTFDPVTASCSEVVLALNSYRAFPN